MNPHPSELIEMPLSEKNSILNYTIEFAGILYIAKNSNVANFLLSRRAEVGDSTPKFQTELDYYILI